MFFVALHLDKLLYGIYYRLLHIPSKKKKAIIKWPSPPLISLEHHNIYQANLKQTTIHYFPQIIFGITPIQLLFLSYALYINKIQKYYNSFMDFA